MNYPCTGCGLCCVNAGKAVLGARQLIAAGVFDNNPYVRELAEFPFHFTADGACENLAPDHSCRVYDARPDICNIERTWYKYHSEAMSLKQYYSQSIDVCNMMMTDAGIDKKYLIND